MRKFNANFLATIGGLLTSVVTAIAVVDFDTFNVHRVNDWVKLIAIALPAIGGACSSLNVKKKDDTRRFQ